MKQEVDIGYWAAKVGSRLRERRKHLKLNLDQLSILSGSSVPTLSNIERGKRDVKLSTLVALAAALRIDLTSLFEPEADRVSNSETRGDPKGYDLGDSGPARP